MNWRWLIPVWGLRVAMDDASDNCNNNYMDTRMLPIVMYQLFVVSLLILNILG